MKPIRNFTDFINNNTVKIGKIDRSRAEFLMIEAENSYNNLLEKKKKILLTDVNAADFLKSCYDTIMELIRSKMLLQGYNASGFGAHEAEVSFMRVLGFDEKEVQFVDQMRFFRNGIVYYGTKQDKEYAKIAVEFTLRIYPRLKTRVK